MTDVTLETFGAAFAFSLASALIEMPLQAFSFTPKNWEIRQGRGYREITFLT